MSGAFIGAPEREIVFTRNTTEGINLVAYALSNAATAKEPEFRKYAVGQGDEIVVTEMEHHANLLPWQQLCERTGATLRWLGLTDAGRLDLSDLTTVVNERTKLVAVTQQSNILGTINPLGDIVARAHEVGALGLVGGGQWGAPQPGGAGSPTSRSTWPSWARTSWSSPGTRCSARPASVCCGGATTSWTSCRP